MILPPLVFPGQTLIFAFYQGPRNGGDNSEADAGDGGADVEDDDGGEQDGEGHGQPKDDDAEQVDNLQPNHVGQTVLFFFVIKLYFVAEVS